MCSLRKTADHFSSMCCLAVLSPTLFSPMNTKKCFNVKKIHYLVTSPFPVHLYILHMHLPRLTGYYRI